MLYFPLMGEYISTANPQAIVELGMNASVEGIPLRRNYGLAGILLGDTVYISSGGHESLLTALADQGVEGVIVKKDFFGDSSPEISSTVSERDCEGFRVNVWGNGKIEVMGESGYLLNRGRYSSHAAREHTVAVLRRAIEEAGGNVEVVAEEVN